MRWRWGRELVRRLADNLLLRVTAPILDSYEVTVRKLLLTFLLAATPALPCRISMSEPTKKELLARIAELRTRLAPEKQAR